ncbi:peptidase S9 [Erythrobacter sp. YT30]|nr:peptidase S9 [Erythrobacter sp. YT30]
MVRKTGSRTQYELRGGSIGLYRVNLETMATSKVGRVTRAGVYRDWLIDSDGSVSAILDVEVNTGNWQLLSNANGEIASGNNPAGAIEIVGFNADGSGIILSERTSDDVFWSEVPLEGGSREPILDDLDIDRAYFDPRSGRLIGYLEGGESERVSFDNPVHQEIVQEIRNAFSGFRVRMVDWTSDLGNVIVRTSGNRDSGTFYAVNLEKMSAKAIAYERMKIGPQEVGPISTFRYKAGDGLEMEGILTLPPHKEAKDLPVVVLPHGGPHSHDVAEFDWWAQAFASRGYAVLQPNFRGSTNDTVEFFMAGFGEWGKKMQTDKSDGLAALAEAGIVNKDRACIVGASYGGYAALAGVTLQQGIYRCAVSVNGVSDIGEKYGIIRGSSARTLQTAREERLGPREQWKEVSPLRFASQADAPIMLIHGANDTVVEYKHSSMMADKLKDAGKTFELVKLKGEDHWLSLSETRQQMLEKAVAFVQKHNPAD